MPQLLLAVLLAANPPSFPQLQKQCDAKNAVACRQLGDALSEKDKNDDRPAYVAWSRGCELGDPRSCSEAGTLLVQGKGMARDLAEAERLFHSACLKDLPGGCLSEGLLLHSLKRDASVPLQRAFDLGKEPCEAGTLAACELRLRAADLYPKYLFDRPERVKFTTRYCNLGADWACGALSQSLVTVKGKEDEAQRLATAACSKNVRSGCEVLAAIAFGKGEFAEAARTSFLACDLEHSAACHVKGLLLAYGKGVAADAGAAFQALNAACGPGQNDACVSLYNAASILKLSDERLRDVEDRACASRHADACARVMDRNPEKPGFVLEMALELLCEAPGTRAERQTQACERLGRISAAKGDPKAQGFLGTACSRGQTSACEEVLKGQPAPEQRFVALKKLCSEEAPQWCGPLARELAARQPVEHDEVARALLWACRADGGNECEQLESEMRFPQTSILKRKLAAACSPSRPSLCRAAETAGERGKRPTWVLCASGDLAACARVNDAQPADMYAWALAVQCKAGVAGTCAALEKLKRPDLAEQELPSFRAERRLRAAAWVASLGPLPPREVTRLECMEDDRCVVREAAQGRPHVERWFATLPREATLRALAHHEICSVVEAFGVPAKVLTVPLSYEIYSQNKEAKLFVGRTDKDSIELPLGRHESLVSVCAGGWMIEDEIDGDLTLRNDRLAFEQVSAGEPPPVTYAPRGMLGVGVDFLAGLPGDGKSFIEDTGTMGVHLSLIGIDPVTFTLRAGLVLPVGKNRVGLTLDVGVVFGRIFTTYVMWRPAQLLFGIWAAFAPSGKDRFMLVPALSTEVGFALGEVELAVELGAKLPLSVTKPPFSLLPLEATVAPYVAINIRPTIW